MWCYWGESERGVSVLVGIRENNVSVLIRDRNHLWCRNTVGYILYSVTNLEFLFLPRYSTNINRLLHVPGTVLDTGNSVVIRYGFPAFESVSYSVMSSSLQPHGLLLARLLWNSPGKNTGVDSHSLLQGIFSTKGQNPGLWHCRQIVYHWATREAQLFLTCHWYKSAILLHMFFQTWGNYLEDKLLKQKCQVIKQTILLDIAKMLSKIYYQFILPLRL